MVKNVQVNDIPANPLEALRLLLASDLQQVDALIMSLVKSQAQLIPQVSGYTIAAGGKRLRPLLTLACARMCNIEKNCHIDLATSVEFIHTATLLHDDVVDESELRRGVSTANDLWGNKESILVGDYLLGKAFHLMGSARSLRVFDILSNASVVISEGEVLQLSATGNIDTTEEEYLQIISAKTAELFAAACEIAPVMAEHPEEEAEALRQFGLNLGIAFQMIDDALDYSSRQETLGKKIGDDFRERKVTLPVIFSYQRGGTDEKAFWRRTIGEGNQNEEDVRTAVALVNSGQVLDDVIDRARSFAKMACRSLHVFGPSDYKNALLDIVDFVVEREY